MCFAASASMRAKRSSFPNWVGDISESSMIWSESEVGEGGDEVTAMQSTGFESSL